MAGQLCQYAEQQALEAVFLRTQSPTAGTVQLAMLTAEPAATVLTMAGASEYGATGYSRQNCAMGAATAASPSVMSNSGTITFGPFTAGTGATVTAWAIVSGSGSTANIIAKGPVTTSRTPSTGDSLQASAASFAVTLT